MKTIILASLLLFGQIAFSQNNGSWDIQSPRSNKQNKSIDSKTLSKSFDQAELACSKAFAMIERSLPAYGGRRQSAKFYTRFALENLQLAKNYKRRSPSDVNLGKSQNRPTMRERIKSIPAVKEKSRRDFTSADMVNSDDMLNRAGIELQDALELVRTIPDNYDGIVREAGQYIDMALSDIVRSIGRIKRPKVVRR